ncbi:phospholipase d [Musa troglodytarum]|uniref:phospholipase D n=1 Tax=Musa troglodytarum TaxID=320322 RepID=A0A9E7JHJ7_9LILI|nr:phospholipase d [Musa troglodytarum]
MQSEPSIAVPSSHSFRLQEHPLIFDELPKADIVSVSRPDATDIIPMLLSYTVEFRYKSMHLLRNFMRSRNRSKDGSKILVLVCLCLLCKMTMKLMMSLLLKAQEENLSAKSRDIPSSAALPIIRPALGRQHSVSDRAKVAMQGYLNHFLGSFDIVNSQEVCKFLEVSRLSSHHEKIVIVDNQICFTGGLDLCFGRHDNFEHKFGDSPPLIWPGKDYYDPRSKASNEQAIPLLMPQHNMVIPHYMGKKRKMNVPNNEQNNNHKDLKKFGTFILSRHPAVVTTRTGWTSSSKWKCRHQDQPFPFRRNKVEHPVQDVQLKGFVDDLGSPQSQRDGHISVISQLLPQNMEEWRGTQERGSQVVTANEATQVGPHTPCRCQVIRSVGQWSSGTNQAEESIHDTYFSLIERAEHFIYIENQFFISGLSGDAIIKNRVLEAHYCRIIKAEKENKCFRIIIVIPLLPGFQGEIDDGGAASVRAIMHCQYRTTCRGPNSILQKLYDLMGPRATEFISFYGLRAYGRLCDGGPLVTNQVYVHSKLMIVDDQVALVGSANINDRSLLDQEIPRSMCLLKIKNLLNHSWMENHGKLENFPIVFASYCGWNTWVSVLNRSAFPQSTNHINWAYNRPEKLEAYQNGDIKNTDPMERLQSVRGHLVSFPLDFMCNEDLRLGFIEGEFYSSRVSTKLCMFVKSKVVHIHYYTHIALNEHVKHL